MGGSVSTMESSRMRETISAGRQGARRERMDDDSSCCHRLGISAEGLQGR